MDETGWHDLLANPVYVMQAAANMLAGRSLSDEVDQLLARDRQHHLLAAGATQSGADGAPPRSRLLDAEQCAPLIAAM